MEIDIFFILFSLIWKDFWENDELINSYLNVKQTKGEIQKDRWSRNS